MTVTLTLNGNSSILATNYFHPIDLKENEYTCGLVEFQTYNSILNIDEDNNRFIIGDKIITIHTTAHTIKIASHKIE